MKVLTVSPYVPYDGIPHAGGQYLLRHLEQLRAVGPVTLLAPGTPPCLADAHRAPAWLDLVVAPLEDDERDLLRRLADAAYRRARAAPPMPTAESLRALRRAGLVERARAADLVEVHWPEYARLVVELRRAGVRTPVSVVEHDVHVRSARDRYRMLLHGYRRALAVATAPLDCRAELAGLRLADLVLVFKASDGDLLREEGVETPVRVLDPWLEVPQGPAPQRVPGQVLFTGAMWRDENDVGARWFVREVWPQVRREEPSAVLRIVGSGPSEELRVLAGQVGGVEVCGAVPSLLPAYRSASLFVAPLFTGGGLKFKVAQAMVCGLPVVATTTAVAGVVEHAPPGTLWSVSDDPHVTADRLVAALRSPADAAAVGVEAAAWAAAHWSFSRSMAAVVGDYLALVAARS